MSWLPLVGHETARRRFETALARGRLGQAYLLVGPEGIGKRRLARHIAQSLLCQRFAPPHLMACGACPACKQLEADAHPDLAEFGQTEGKNIVSIETVKELCHWVVMKPVTGHRKIAILDDADLMGEEAVNALLKTLEEPPPGCLILLIATSEEAQKATILSRCQLVRMTPLATEQVATLLEQLGSASSAAEAQRLGEVSDGSIHQALALADPIWTRVRQNLVAALTATPVMPVSLMQIVHQFLDEEKLDAAAKRQRARHLLRIVANFFQAALRQQQGALDPIAADDQVRQLAARVSPETVVDLLERCLQADYHLNRYLNQTLALDCWLDDVSQILAGQYVAAIEDD